MPHAPQPSPPPPRVLPGPDLPTPPTLSPLSLRVFVVRSSYDYRPRNPKRTTTLAHSGGPSISRPTTTAVAAPTSTAAAATSLPTLASGCRSGEARSTTASSEVLMNSAIHTMATVSRMMAHSSRPSPSHSPSKKTAVEKTAWIQALRWVRSMYHQPAKACRNESSRDDDRLWTGGSLFVFKGFHSLRQQPARPRGAGPPQRREALALDRGVGDEEVLHLVQQRRLNLAQLGNTLVQRRLGRHCHQPVVALGAPCARLHLPGLNHADQPAHHQAAHKSRLVHQQQNIQRVPVFAQGRGDVAKVERKRQPLGQHPLQPEQAQVHVKLVLVPAALGRVHDSMHFRRVARAQRRQLDKQAGGDARLLSRHLWPPSKRECLEWTV